MCDGPPTIIRGYDPAAMRPEPIQLKNPCLNARGAVDLGDMVVYPGDDGMVMVTPGSAGVATESVFAREEWEQYNPSTIIGAEYNGSYVGFYTKTSGVAAGFVFDPRSRESMWTPLDFGADAAWTDPKTGDLYIVRNEQILKWDAHETQRFSYDWRSRRNVSPAPFNPAYGRVVAEQYPVDFRLYANRNPNSPEELVQVIAKTVNDSQPFALPDGYAADAFELGVAGSAEVSSVAVASTVRELMRGR
jgi:hypothetical protein